MEAFKPAESYRVIDLRNKYIRGSSPEIKWHKNERSG